MAWFSRRRDAALRPLSYDHARAAARIHVQGFARGWDTQEIAALLRDPSVRGDAALEGETDALQGFVLSRVAADEAEVLTLAIDRRAQGRGLGGLLFEAHRARLAAEGVRALFLEVDENNAAARALYARAGFEEVGARKAYYPLADGSRARALILRKTLS